MRITPSNTGSSERRAQRRQTGFTMIEIALCLGIIAFALVAIIGVLPTGVKVQQENREETIVNEEGLFLLEAIRSGSKGIEDLTNYVDYLEVGYELFVNRQNEWEATILREYTPPNGSVFGKKLPLTNAQHIVGLLSTPTLQRLANGRFQINGSKMWLRPVNGNALEMRGRERTNDFVFRYQVETEITPFRSIPPGLVTATMNEIRQSTNLLENLYEVRLTLSWPLYPRGKKADGEDNWEVGRNRKIFRTLVSGELRASDQRRNSNPEDSIYLFEPQSYTSTF